MYSTRCHQKIHTIKLYWKETSSINNVHIYQGDHSPGKPGKVREFQSGQGKVRGSDLALHAVKIQ